MGLTHSGGITASRRRIVSAVGDQSERSMFRIVLSPIPASLANRRMLHPLVCLYERIRSMMWSMLM